MDEMDVAYRILTRAPTGYPEDEQFRNNVRAIVRAQKGDPRGGVRMLDEAANEYEARGMAHWALGAAVHAAYWRETLVRGGGASRAAGLVRDIGARGGEGFAYYLPEVASWLGRSAERDPAAREGKRLDRASLAERLGVSPNTLRVHLTRIRAKLDVGDRRGDEVLLSAALTQRPVA